MQKIAGAGLFDIRQYGAKPSPADNRAAIQRAISAASAAGGGTVFIPVGTFLIGPATDGAARIFDVPSNIHVRGEGPRSIIKIKNNAGDYGAIFENASSPVANVRFSDLTIDQNPSGNTTCDIQVSSGTSQVAIHLWKAGDVSVDNVRFWPCTGVNTVSIGADDTVPDTQAAVRNCRFKFTKATTTLDPQGDGNPYYDNSCVYLETENQIVTGNSFETTLADDAFGCIEVHGGRATVVGNVAVNFETLVNVVTRANAAGYTDTDPSQIVVSGNSLTGGKKGIMFWPATGRALRGVVVTNNAIEITNAMRGTPAHWHNNDGYVGIGNTYSTGGSLDGEIDGLLIADNIIAFEHEDRAYAAGYETLTGGVNLSIQGVGGIRNVDLHGNTIVNAPQAGISVWARNSTAVIERVWAHHNIIVDAGQNNAGNSAYRAAILLAASAGGAQLKHVTAEDNLIIDTATGGTPNGFRGVITLVTLGEAVFVRRNRAEMYGSGSLVFSDSPSTYVTHPIGADRGDASVTLKAGVDSVVQRWATTLTASRTVTLSTSGAQAGDRFRIVRTGLGSFTLAVGSLKTIPSATAAFVDVEYDGTAWVLTGYGAL